MANVSYCRYENASYDMQDVVDALFDCSLDEKFSTFELGSIKSVLKLAKDIIDMEDKINNIIENNENI